MRSLWPFIRLLHGMAHAVVKAAGLTALGQVKPALDDDNYDAALRLVNFAEEAVRKTTPDGNKPKPDEE